MSLKSIANEKVLETFSNFEDRLRRKDQGPKSESPSGRRGTKYSALPNDRRRPPDIGVVSVAGEQVHLAAAAPPVEARDPRPVGTVLGPKARQARIGRALTVPAHGPVRVEDELLEHLDAGESHLVLLGLLQRVRGGQALIAIRVEVNESQHAGWLHTRRILERRFCRHVAVLGVASGGHVCIPQAAEAARKRIAEAATDKRCVRLSEGLEDIRLLEDALARFLVDDDAELSPAIELKLDSFDDRLGRAI